MSPCVGRIRRITQALGNLGWHCVPGLRIKDPVGDISIFNEWARPRAVVGCQIAFIRAAQSGDGRAAQMEDSERNCRCPGSYTQKYTLNIFLNPHSGPLKSMCQQWSIFFAHLQCTVSLFNLQKGMDKDIKLACLSVIQPTDPTLFLEIMLIKPLLADSKAE